MTELIVFPDVEVMAVTVINADPRRLVDWSTRVANPRPAEFGRLMRIGGPRESFVSENALLTLEGWAATESRALAILNRGRAILAAQDGALFGYSEPGGPNNLPDPTVPDQVRYTLIVSVRARGSVIA